MSQLKAFFQQYRNRLLTFLFWINIGIVISYIGLGMVAARQDLLWRADFTAYYTGAALVRDGQGDLLYDLDVQAQYQQAMLEGRSFLDGVLPFNYPPYFSLLLLPLAYLSLPVAFGTWVALQIGFLIGALVLIWRSMDGWLLPQRRLFISAMVALPYVMRALLQGTSSLLTLFCLMQIYAALVRGKPARGGFWLALGTIRPQALLPIGIFVLIQRRWRVALGALIVGLVIVALTTLALGPGIWSSFVDAVARSGQLVDRLGVYPAVMYNLRGVLTLGLGNSYGELIGRISLVGFLLAMLLLVGLWYPQMTPGKAMFDLRLALGLVLGIFFSLHLNPHDGVLLILPLLLMGRYLHSQQRLDLPALAIIGGIPIFVLITEYGLRDFTPVHGTVVMMAGLTLWMGLELLEARKTPAGGGGEHAR